jgi:hypothetical protein
MALSLKPTCGPQPGCPRYLRNSRGRTGAQSQRQCTIQAHVSNPREVVICPIERLRNIGQYRWGAARKQAMPGREAARVADGPQRRPGSSDLSPANCDSAR